MRTSDELLRHVNIAIEQLDLEKAPAKLYGPIRYVLSIGGKRLRPVLCLMAYELYDAQIEKAIKASIALEIFHNFTLLHDDIMDKAEKRRNMDCVHIKWDENVAILSGDTMQILSYQVLNELPEKHLKDCLTLFSQTAIEVCEGQQYDMDFERQEKATVEEYMKMIRLKTAVLVAASLKMGSLIGGASNKEAELLYEFGIELGLAFQLKDDLLDVYGNSLTFGKKIGGDILCNKKTYLLIQALDNADPKTLEKLHYWLNKSDFIPEDKIKAITEIFNQLGIKDLCLLEIEKHQKLAFEYLKQISVSDICKEPLIQFANELMDRKN